MSESWMQEAPAPCDQVVVALGTRPEVIKLAGVVRALGSHSRVIHTGQHYDETMWDSIVAEFPGFRIDHHIEVGGHSRGEQIGLATVGITKHLRDQPARAVVVQGDTNSTLAGALAASSLGTPVVHVEAGLRSHDRNMPEEINRILVDALADLCCAPVPANAEQLAREGVDPSRVLVTGNTLADAMQVLRGNQEEELALREQDGLTSRYVLSTIHRAGNVDHEPTLRSLFTGLGAIAADVPVVVPLHPHTAKQLTAFDLDHLLEPLKVLQPTNPREFMALEAGATLILSDSGGVQEEACLLRRPLLVLRDSTERPELVDGGWCRLLGSDDPASAVIAAWKDAADWESALRDKPFPYQEAPASQTIVDEINRRWPAS